MTIELQELPGEPIITVAVRMPHDPQADVVLSLQAVSDFKKKRDGHVYRVVDLSLFDLSFSEAMVAMGVEVGKDGGINDPDVSTVYVGSGEWVQFGVKAFREQEQYGTVNILHLCETIEEGIAFARSDIEKKK
ncbi:MAG: hypothetical protein JXQ72_01820 [Anaerolineae bacterium]|nr:hypothetical protein [Anaerolineae bacterium]